MCKRSYDLRCVRRAVLLGSSAVLALTGFGEAAFAQVNLPQVTVSGAKPKTKPHPVQRRAAAPTATPPAAVAPVNAADVKNNEFDNARTNLYTTVGTTSETISTTPSTHSRKAPTRLWRRCCCKRSAFRRIPRRAVCSTSAMITQTCSSASTASCCPTASPASAAYWTRA